MALGLTGGPEFRHSEAFSFQVATDTQEETDRYWNAIVGNGGQESQCGWCKDRWGLSWQITPRVLTDALAAGVPRHDVLSSDDADGEDRHRHDRGSAAGLTWTRGCTTVPLDAQGCHRIKPGSRTRVVSSLVGDPTLNDPPVNTAIRSSEGTRNTF